MSNFEKPSRHQRERIKIQNKNRSLTWGEVNDLLPAVDFTSSETNGSPIKHKERSCRHRLFTEKWCKNRSCPCQVKLKCYSITMHVRGGLLVKFITSRLPPLTMDDSEVPGPRMIAIHHSSNVHVHWPWLSDQPTRWQLDSTLQALHCRSNLERRFGT